MSYDVWKSKVPEFKTVDVRHIQGNFFPGIQKQASALKVGEGLKIIQTFEPHPLYGALEALGFEHHTEQAGETEYHAYFYRAEMKEDAQSSPFKPLALLNYPMIDETLGRIATDFWNLTWNDEKRTLPYQENQITIAYDTMSKGTAKLAHAIAKEISSQSPDTVVKIFHTAKADKNEIMTEVFKSRAIVVGSPTVYNDILTSVAGWLAFLKILKFKNKKAAAFGCYGWSGEGVKVINDKLAEAGFSVSENGAKAQWNPDDNDFSHIPALVKGLLDSCL